VEIPLHYTSNLTMQLAMFFGASGLEIRQLRVKQVC
jgi:hypothetical protein